jgi:hypothetical protein
MDDEKVSELFKEFGYEGTGLFHAILEKLAKQEKPIKTDILKYQLKVGKRLEKCWSFMESLGIISSNNGDTFNKQLLNYAESYQIKKEKTAKKVSEWRENQKNKETVTGYETVSNPPKVKESKVKESKVNKISTDSLSENGKSLHEKFIAVHSDWYKNNRVGEVYKFNGAADGEGAKQLIAYFKKSFEEKNNIPPGDEQILNAWKFILSNFSSWDQYYQGQLKISQINSNLPNILANIKSNGSINKRAGKQPATNKRTGVDSLTEINRLIDEGFAKGMPR